MSQVVDDAQGLTFSGVNSDSGSGSVTIGQPDPHSALHTPLAAGPLVSKVPTALRNPALRSQLRLKITCRHPQLRFPI